MRIENYDQEIKTLGVVVVDFYADWCGPCRMQTPILEQLQAEKPFKLLKVNVDHNEELMLKQGISHLPTLKIFKDGKEVTSLTGLQSVSVLRPFVS